MIVLAQMLTPPVANALEVELRTMNIRNAGAASKDIGMTGQH